MRSFLLVAALLGCAMPVHAADPLAEKFGARTGIISASLSPDGHKIAMISAAEGQSSRLFILDTDAGGEPKSILKTSGTPDKLYGCQWIAANRLICKVGGISRYGDDLYGFSSLIALDDDGKNLRSLEQRRGENALGFDLRGGTLVDLLPDEDGQALVMRSYVPEGKAGSIVEKKARGMGLDHVDTRTGTAKTVERPRDEAESYISDGSGHVRLQLIHERDDEGYDTSHYRTFYRPKGHDDWVLLARYEGKTDEGFYPAAVDGDADRAIGYQKIDGRQAVVAIKLDGTGKTDVLFKHSEVDAGGLITVGRRSKVIGVTYVTDFSRNEYFDQATRDLLARLGKALGGRTVYILDTNADQSRLLLWSGSDQDPGQIYLFDKGSKQLAPVVPQRPQLSGAAFAKTQAISFPAADGTAIPGYLTVPAGKDAHGLPAIVLPHGGPASRDDGGFDWMVQYFVARGFAVLQPNFRGSAGYGDAWFKENGFKSWNVAVGDVVDAGRWLVKEGIAKPDDLTIFGWSYGGYAALQSAVVAPDLFKAVVAVAPVTDFATLTDKDRDWSNYYVERDFIGQGPHIKQGSPAQNVDKIKAPVLMFQGTFDRNVDEKQARLMQSRLQGAGKASQLVIFEGLDHQLDDSNARAQMLEQSANFLLSHGKSTAAP